MSSVARSAASSSAHISQPRHPSRRSRRQKLKSPRLAENLLLNRDLWPQLEIQRRNLTRNQRPPVLETNRCICPLKR